MRVKRKEGRGARCMGKERGDMREVIGKTSGKMKVREKRKRKREVGR